MREREKAKFTLFCPLSSSCLSLLLLASRFFFGFSFFYLFFFCIPSAVLFPYREGGR